MKSLSRFLQVVCPPLAVLLFCGFASQPARTSTPLLVVTAAPAYRPLAALSGGERFPRGAQLLLVRDGQATPLVEGFAQTADADVSFDGKKLLFTGKENATDNWSIWEFTFEERSVRKVIGGKTDSIRPLYLPENHLVYARLTDHGFQLNNAKLDGTGTLPLSYINAAALPETVLADGRILFVAGFPLGTDIARGATPELFLVYSDGSGIESYRCDHGAPRWGGKQLASGDLVFTHGLRLARFTSSLATEATVTAPSAEYAGAPVETETGTWLVSARASTLGHYALKQFKPGSKGSLLTVLSRPGEDLVEPVLVTPRKRPNHHPTALHKWDYANLLALDARQSRDGALKARPTAVRMESLDAKGDSSTLGMSPVESDGSFFVKVPADRPIRFALLDEKGVTLRKERGWFWTRKGEQRYCVGCHAGPEHAPDNRVPQVLLHTTTPVDLTGSGHQAKSGGQ